MRRNRDLFRAAGALLFAAFAAGCGDAGEPLPPGIARLGEEPAGAAVLEAIAAHGGWSAWSAKETVEYEFRWTAYSPEGVPGLTSTEFHRFRLQGRIRGRIERPEEDLIVAYNGHVGWAGHDGGKRLDRNLMPVAQSFVRRLHWIFRVPFNLVEVNVRLQDEGERDGLRAVKILFPIGMGVLEKDWHRVFIDPKTHQVRELFMNAEQGRSWMEFSDLHEVDGVLIPHRRRVYQVGPDGEKGNLSHEMELRNVRFNVPLEDELFDPPVPLEPVTPPAGGTPPPPPAGG